MNFTKDCQYQFTRYHWKALLKWFLRCQSANVIREETGWSKYKILEALGLVRQAMARDIYVHRTVEHQKKEYTKGNNHINGLEGFWGYLKRQLASRGGIRREKLPLYLAEYVWRHNNRKLSVERQIEKLFLVAKI
jgi:hypothetical protein